MTEAQLAALLAQWRVIGPIVIVAAPLAAACVVALLRSSRWSGAISGFALALIALGAVDIGYAAMTARTAIEPLAGFMLIVQAAIALTVGLGAGGLLNVAAERASAWSLGLLAAACAFGVSVFSTSPPVAALALMGLGFSSIALCAVVAGQARAALQAALIGVCACGVGAAFVFAGLGLSGDAMAHAFALALIAAGVLMLCGVFPFDGPIHLLWRAAPSGAALVLATLCTLTALTALAPLTEHLRAGPLGAASAITLGALGAVGAVMSAVQAALARDMRRLVASTLASHAACVLIGFAAAQNAQSVAAGLVHAVALALIAVGLIGSTAVIAPHAGAMIAVSRLDGLGRRRPLAAATLAICLLSAVGAPLTFGFLSKWQVIQAALSQGWWWAAAAMLLASLAFVAPAGRIIERLYFTPEADAEPPALSNVALAPVLGVVVIATVVLGVTASDLALWAAYAASGGGR